MLTKLDYAAELMEGMILTATSQERKSQGQSSFLDNLIFYALVISLIGVLLIRLLFGSIDQPHGYSRYFWHAINSQSFRGYLLHSFVHDGYEAYYLAQFFKEQGNHERAQQLSRYGLYLMSDDKTDPLVAKLEEMTK